MCQISLMRVWLILLLLHLGVWAASAQIDERKLIDRVTEPDKEKINTSFNTEFYGGEKFEQGNQAAVVRDFQYENRVNSKSFQTRDYLASTYWTGDFQFETKSVVDTKGNPVEKNSGQYSTREFATDQANEAKKTRTVREYGEADKEFRGQESPRMDKAIDPADQSTGWRGNLDVMTMDDIRDLLNKN